MISKNLYLIEGLDYFTKRGIHIPTGIEKYRDSIYCFSNTQSIVNLLAVIFLKLARKHVYFLPDGILEASNIRRSSNFSTFIALKICDGVLVGDLYSYRTALYLKLPMAKVKRWPKIHTEVDGSGKKSIIVATAKTAYFNRREFEDLKRAIINVVTNLDSNSKIIASLPEELLSNIKAYCQSAENIPRCGNLIKSSLCTTVISTPSTLLIESAMYGHTASLIPFRKHDADIAIDLSFPNNFRYDDFIFVNQDVKLSVSRTKWSLLSCLEQKSKSAFKKLLTHLYA